MTEITPPRSITLQGGSVYSANGTPAEKIVAINRDPKAEVFQYADYCVVGDMFSIIPELQERMEADRYNRVGGYPLVE